MVDEIVVGFEDPRVLKAGEPEARLWSSLPNREPVAHQNPGAMVSEPTRRASWVRHVESDSPPSGNRPRVTISGTRYKACVSATLCQSRPNALQKKTRYSISVARASITGELWPTLVVEKGALNAWDEFKDWERCAEKGGRPRDVEKLIEDDVDQGRHDCGH